jgi:hypothetical protein
MTIKITLRQRSALALIGLAGLQAACSGKDSRARAEGGSVDLGAKRRTAAAAFPGAPGVRVTRTDSRSITEARVYRLTTQNFAAFMVAAERLAALERRDPDVRAYLAVNISDAGAPDAEAGRNWLVANAKARHAIESSGMTVADYYVASISVADAERFLNHPKSVPETPALARNARLLQSHGRDLARLRALRAR